MALAAGTILGHGSSFEVGAMHTLYNVNNRSPNTAGQQFSVTADGQRFLQIYRRDRKRQAAVKCDSELDSTATVEIEGRHFGIDPDHFAWTGRQDCWNLAFNRLR
jgi:hypothetical protein